VLFAGLLKHWGSKGPAELPGKRRFTYRHVLWLARRHGIRFQAPPAHPFNPLSALRLSIALNNQPEVIHAIFRFIWQEGRRPDEPADWAELCARFAGADPAALIDSPDVKNTLRANTAAAIERGVFGVPTFAIEDELFWGFDATEMVLDYLNDPSLLDEPEMVRVSSLPVGVMRR
jgi:2-hydroxychromene-2-carboxylate isomerase